MERREAVSTINLMTPDAFLQKAKKRGYICPACENGSGRDGDGIVRNPRTGKYKCFKCGAGGDILDLVGLAFGLDDFNEKLKKAAEIYGIPIDRYQGNLSSTPTTPKPKMPQIREVVTLPKEDLSDYFSRCEKAADQTDYFQKRGLSDETVKAFGLGFDPAYDERNVGARPWKAAIIPTSEATFEARNTEVDPNSVENGKNKYRKHGETRIFNLISLQEEKDRPVFVVEGSFDALSLIECGAPAISLGSCVNGRILLEELNKTTPSKPLLLLFDADEAGKDNSIRLEEELKKRRIPYLSCPEVLGNYHDANDRLVHDREGLIKAIEEVYRKAEGNTVPADDTKTDYLRGSAGRSLQDMIAFVQSRAGRFRISTGFYEIDKSLGGGLYAGLYVIGAISSLGKTTLALQLADNLAKAGNDILFFSLEQSKYDLMSKSISRESYRYCRLNDIEPGKAKSNLSILDGSRWDSLDETEKTVMNEAFQAYRSYAERIFFFEGIGNITVAQIRDHIKQHISLTGNTPIVFVDYLQVLKESESDRRASDKQIVDHNITALKQISRDFCAPVIAVSSLNRQNYSERINMAAFKESGSIEYGSDVLIGLQLTGAGKTGFDLEKEKEKNPRSIDFCILKNRNGCVYSKGVPLLFYPEYNYFSEGRN